MHIKNPTQKTVCVGISGGVDSSVSALILKKYGFNVIGLFMKNWDLGPCTAKEDFEDAASVCDQLDIPYYTLNFAQEYKSQVFDQFVEGLKKGLTPNPDILCNREIKFKVFFNQALKMGADFIATGHYCQNESSLQGDSFLKKGFDPGKDQSYFLHEISEDALKKTLFPIGHLMKKQVRQIASEFKLTTNQKKDSTGICFIGKRNFKDFMQSFIPTQQGPIVDNEGAQVGVHEGIHFYTIGQRQGLGLGGPGEAWYVYNKDLATNTLYVLRGGNHPLLFKDHLYLKDIYWISPKDLETSGPIYCKIRYRQNDQECLLEKSSQDLYRVSFKVPQRAITPDQSIVFYQENKCLGGGRILDYFDPS